MKEQGAAPPSPRPGPPGFVEPSFGQRLLARLVDALLFLPLAAVLGLLAGGRVLAAAGIAAVAVYEVTLVTLRGQTIGKIVMGLRIVDVNSGANPSLQQAVLRWLVLAAGSLATLIAPALDPIAVLYALIVLAPILRPPLHRGLHDRAARALVTLIGR